MSRNQYIFSIASLVNGISFSMILPLLAPIIRQLKLSELQGGAMVSAGALFMAIAAIYLSKHQSKYSIYQLLVIGFVGMSLTWAIFSGVLLYSMHSTLTVISIFLLLLIARAATGIFMAMPQIALQTYVMTAFESETVRSQTMSKFGALNSFGIIIGPFLTTLFLVGGIQMPLWIAVLLLALVSLLIMTMYERQNDPSQIKSFTQNNADQLSTNQSTVEDSTLSIKPILFWLILGFYLYLAIVTLNLTAGFYIQDHFKIDIHNSAVLFSQCSLIVGVSLVSMQIMISKYLKCSVYQLLTMGIVAMAIGLIMSIYTDHLRVFQAAYIFYGIAVACFIPAFTTGAAQKAPQHLQAKVAGWCTATQALSFVIGPLISTGLYQWYAALPYYFLIFGLLLLAIYAVFSRYTTGQIQPQDLKKKVV